MSDGTSSGRVKPRDHRRLLFKVSGNLRAPRVSRWPRHRSPPTLLLPFRPSARPARGNPSRARHSHASRAPVVHSPSGPAVAPLTALTVCKPTAVKQPTRSTLTCPLPPSHFSVPHETHWSRDWGGGHFPSSRIGWEKKIQTFFLTSRHDCGVTSSL